MHEKEAKKNQNLGATARTRPPYFYIFRSAFPQLFNVFFVFFITLGLFPSVQSGKCQREKKNIWFLERNQIKKQFYW